MLFHLWLGLSGYFTLDHQLLSVTSSNFTACVWRSICPLAQEHPYNTSQFTFYLLHEVFIIEDKWHLVKKSDVGIQPLARQRDLRWEGKIMMSIFRQTPSPTIIICRVWRRHGQWLISLVGTGRNLKYTARWILRLPYYMIVGGDGIIMNPEVYSN